MMMELRYKLRNLCHKINLLVMRVLEFRSVIELLIESEIFSSYDGTFDTI